MKVINKQNQHEIGFDIDCLPAWANYLYYSDFYVHNWKCSDEEPFYNVRLGVLIDVGNSCVIPADYIPKNISYKDGILFKIDRSEMVKYNGTAI